MKIIKIIKGFVTNSSSANYWLDTVVTRSTSTLPITTSYNDNGTISKKTYHNNDDARKIEATVNFEYDKNNLLEKEVYYNADNKLTKKVFYNENTNMAKEVYYDLDSGDIAETFYHDGKPNVIQFITENKILKEAIHDFSIWLVFSIILMIVLIIKIFQLKKLQKKQLSSKKND